MADGLWARLSPSQQYALLWAALPADSGRPQWSGRVPKVGRRTWTSLKAKGLVGTDVFGTYTATPIGRALLPIEPKEER